MKSKSIQLAAIIALAATSATSAEAATIFVKANAVGANNGTSWTNAFPALQSALSVAVSGDEVWVAAGTYKPSAGGLRTATFSLASGVRIRGGFAGTETLASQRTSTLNVTILSGDQLGDDTPNFGNRSDNSYHVVTATGVNNLGALEGVTIRGGQADGGGASQGQGAGVYVNGGQPQIVNCIIRDNFAANDGGGVLLIGTGARLTNCLVTGNKAGVAGGIDVQGNGVLVIDACTIVANTCTFATDGAGIRFLNFPGFFQLSSCIVWDNQNGTGQSRTAQFQIVNSSQVAAVQCDIEGTPVFPGTLNINTDPLLVSVLGPDGISGTGDEIARPGPGSPCIDYTINASVGPDTSDLDGDADATEHVPFDLARKTREHDDPAVPTGVFSTVDIGAYEFQGSSCIGDIIFNGVVDTGDLVRLLGVFGDVGEPFRFGDLNGDGVVNTVDLTLMLGNFGVVCPS